MKENTAYLKQQAEDARALYRKGVITRKEAIEQIKPYEKIFNEVSAEKAKIYKLKPQRFSIIAYLR